MTAEDTYVVTALPLDSRGQTTPIAFYQAPGLEAPIAAECQVRGEYREIGVVMSFVAIVKRWRRAAHRRLATQRRRRVVACQ